MSPEQNSLLSGAIYHAQALVSAHIRKHKDVDVGTADYLARKYIERALGDVLVMEAVSVWEEENK